ncbi:RWD domain-containing protein 3-like [Diadema antillarum]|uniref:RWD domain-containing protein 3-like n=1 Tax=Diadema antillarum TaxID=105358 RepID=UPI003A89CACC
MSAAGGDDGDAIADELHVLEAVYCQDGEFVLHDIRQDVGSACFTITPTVSLEGNPASRDADGIPFAAKFVIEPGYPLSPPQIMVTSSALTRKAAEELKRDLMTFVREHLLGEPVVIQTLEWIQQHISSYTAKEKLSAGMASQGDDVNDSRMISLLRIDHMRAKTRYIRTLQGWASDLSLTGKILFVDKLILVLLEGQQKNVKEFVLRLRTQKVDVDSSGKSCKEKMMTVLKEAPSAGDSPRFESFDVAELNSIHELKCAFDVVDLAELYSQCVQPLLRHSHQGTAS